VIEVADFVGTTDFIARLQNGPVYGRLAVIQGQITFDGINATGRNFTFSENEPGCQACRFREINLNASSFEVSLSKAASPIPEPIPWAMMLMGFGAVGYSMRKRNVSGRHAACVEV
jgi:hypothetical protein